MRIRGWITLPAPIAQLMWSARQRGRLARYRDPKRPALLSAAATTQLQRTYRQLLTREADLLALLGSRDALPCDLAAARSWPRLDVPRPLPDSRD